MKGLCRLLLMFFTFSLFAEEELSLLFRDLSLVKEVNEEIHDHLPYHYNYSLMGGYFSMPSARMNEVGTAADRVCLRATI